MNEFRKLKRMSYRLQVNLYMHTWTPIEEALGKSVKFLAVGSLKLYAVELDMPKAEPSVRLK